MKKRELKSGLYLWSLNFFGSMNKNFGPVCIHYCPVILHCYIQSIFLGSIFNARTIAANIFFRIHSFSVFRMILIRYTKKLECYFMNQLGRRMESVVLPLELLQQFKSSDFPSQQEYAAWQRKNLKVLEAGLLLHPHLPLEKTNSDSRRLQQIIRGAAEKPLETGKHNEAMQVLRSSVMSLACRSFDGSATETCHWADGFPLNLRLYKMLLEASFDINEDTSIIEEVDEVLELIKKTWVILGLNQMLHNLCFLWVLFHRYVATGQVENDLLFASNNLLIEVEKDAIKIRDPVSSKILSSILSVILGWAEKRLLAYHDNFHSGNVESMQSVVSLGLLSAKILVEDVSYEYRRNRKEVSVTCERVETYIRSSLRTSFAQASFFRIISLNMTMHAR